MVMAVCLVALFALAGVALAPDVFPPKNGVSASWRQAVPKVRVERGMGAPLTISMIDTSRTSEQRPEVHFTITNVANRPIGAYTIRYRFFSGRRSAGGGNDLSDRETLSVALTPGGSDSDSIGEGENVGVPVTAIALSVDFVEFVDGSRWGADLDRSGENIDGYRAGARAAAEALRNLDRPGMEADLAAITGRDGDLGLQPPNGKGEIWLAGFHRGIQFMKGRVAMALREGSGGLEAVIAQPIDATDQATRGER